jgi:hypothetical protein
MGNGRSRIQQVGIVTRLPIKIKRRHDQAMRKAWLVTALLWPVGHERLCLTTDGRNSADGLQVDKKGQGALQVLCGKRNAIHQQSAY